jgi:ribosomal protein L7/L12
MADSAGQELAELVRQGRKIEAIKLVREQTGCGLAEAKAAVEKLERGEPLEGAAPAAPEAALKEEIRTLVLSGRMIDAVKLYRERTGTGLKDAKDAVDAIAAGK